MVVSGCPLSQITQTFPDRCLLSPLFPVYVLELTRPLKKFAWFTGERAWYGGLSQVY